MKPLDIKNKYGFLIALIIVVIAIFGFFEKGIKLYKLIVPNGEILNWRFVAALTILVGLIVWFIMNHLWRKEFEKNQKLEFDLENYREELKISENDRLTDIITGVPNLQSLKNDFENYFIHKSSFKKLQFILIDLKNFRKINNKFGFLKTNELLRVLAQNIYQKMRRNEDMYKYPGEWKKEEKEHFYRVHTGGDEFAFVIEGTQVDALGFANRLVKNQFKYVSSLSRKILGEPIKLSFHCAIVEMDPRDRIEDVFNKANDCYLIAKEGDDDFNICWHPNSYEENFDKDWEKNIYKDTRSLFNVLTVTDKDY